MSNNTPGDIFLAAFNAFYQNMTGLSDEQIQEMKSLRMTCAKLDETNKALKAFLKANDLDTKQTRKLMDEMIKLQKAQTKTLGVSGALSDKHIAQTINKSIASFNSEFNKNSGSDLMKQMLAANSGSNKSLQNLEKINQEIVNRLNDLGAKIANMSRGKERDEKKQNKFWSGLFAKFKGGGSKAPGKGFLSGITDFFTGKKFWGKMVGAIVDGILGAKFLQNTLADVLKLGWLMLASWFDKKFGPKMSGIVAALTAGLGSIAMALLGWKGAAKASKLLFELPKLGKAKSVFDMFKKGKTAKNTLKLTEESSKVLKSFKEAKKAKGAKEVVTTAKIGTSLMVLPETGTSLIPLTQKTGTSLVAKEAQKTGTSLVAKEVAKQEVAKVAGKKVPWFGLGYGAFLGSGRLAEGDYLGAGAEMVSAALPWLGGLAGGVGGFTGGLGFGAVPGSVVGTGVGTAASLGIDAWLIARDMKRSSAPKSTSTALVPVDTSKSNSSKNFMDSIISYFKGIIKPLKGLWASTKKIVKPVLLLSSAFVAIKGILEKYFPLFAEGTETGTGRKGIWSRISSGLKGFIGMDNSGTPEGTPTPGGTSDFITTFTKDLGQRGSVFDGHTVGSPFSNARFHPIDKVVKKHTGIDLNYARGEQVKAKLGGKVVAAISGWNGGYGNTVIIDDGRNLNQYSHLQKIPDSIAKGVYVKAGDIIGYAGSSGRSTGPHLHYEVKTKAGQAIEPARATVERRAEIEKGEGPAVPTAPVSTEQPVQETPAQTQPSSQPKVSSRDPNEDGGNRLVYSRLLDMKAQTNLRNYQSLSAC